ncbi:MAG: PriCT-2 domain-containing protein [Pseudomonadales bacterium]
MNHPPITVEQMRNMLSYIDPHDRELWVSILAAIKAELGTDGLEVCDAWSQQADSYKAADFRAVWASLKKSGITIGTLIHHALQGGYRFTDDHFQETEEQRQARIFVREKRQQQEAVEAIRQAEKKRNKASQLWALSVHFERPMSLYLDNRGLSAVKDRVPSSLRFIPNLAYWQITDDKPVCIGSFPTMVAAVTDLNGDVVAIHRTYLSEDGNKAPVPKVKKLLGSLNGGAVKLSATGNYDVLCLTEGIETGLAVHVSTGFPVWACASAHGLKMVQLPNSIKRVHIMADLDASGTGERVGRELAQRLISEGRKVKLVLPSGSISPGTKSVDWLDVYLAEQETTA